MMATFPLQSCRMGFSWEDDIRDGNFCAALNVCFGQRLGRRRQAVDGDGSRLGAAIKADAAPTAVFAGVVRWMDAVGVQTRHKFETLRRTGLDAESAAFAFFVVDKNVATRELLCRRFNYVIHSRFDYCGHNYLDTAMASGRCNHFVFSQ